MSQEFLEAVKAGDVARVGAMIDRDAALVNTRAESGESAVLLATYYGQKGIRDLLIERGAELNAFEAAAVGKRDRLTELVEKDPSLVRGWSHDGFTLLHLAAFFGHPETVEYLLTKDPDVNAVSRNPMKVMPLHSAAANRDGATAFRICKALVEHGADIQAAQEGGFTPLHEAAHNGNLPLAELLVKAGANVNATLTDGRTPLELARAGGHSAIGAVLEGAVR
jgi:uncharacterized protein